MTPSSKIKSMAMCFGFRPAAKPELDRLEPAPIETTLRYLFVSIKPPEPIPRALAVGWPSDLCLALPPVLSCHISEQTSNNVCVHVHIPSHQNRPHMASPGGGGYDPGGLLGSGLLGPAYQQLQHPYVSGASIHVGAAGVRPRPPECTGT